MQGVKLIGITGPIGHGKSTVAELILQEVPKSSHLESFHLIAEVVQQLHRATKTIPSNDIDEINKWLKPLKSILKQVVNYECTNKDITLVRTHVKERPHEYEKLFVHLQQLRNDPSLLTQTITDANKAAFRPILQWVGGYFAKKIDPGIWYNQLISLAHQSAGKGAELCVIGGVRFPTDAEIIKETGGYVIKVYRPGVAQAEMSDMTERERESIHCDCTIINNGGIMELKRCVRKMTKDLMADSLKAKYQASER